MRWFTASLLCAFTWFEGGVALGAEIAHPTFKLPYIKLHICLQKFECRTKYCFWAAENSPAWIRFPVLFRSKHVFSIFKLVRLSCFFFSVCRGEETDVWRLKVTFILKWWAFTRKLNTLVSVFFSLCFFEHPRGFIFYRLTGANVRAGRLWVPGEARAGARAAGPVCCESLADHRAHPVPHRLQHSGEHKHIFTSLRVFRRFDVTWRTSKYNNPHPKFLYIVYTMIIILLIYVKCYFGEYLDCTTVLLDVMLIYLCNSKLVLIL